VGRRHRRVGQRINFTASQPQQPALPAVPLLDHSDWTLLLLLLLLNPAMHAKKQRRSHCFAAFQTPLVPKMSTRFLLKAA